MLILPDYQSLSDKKLFKYMASLKKRLDKLVIKKDNLQRLADATEEDIIVITKTLKECNKHFYNRLL